MIRCPHCGGELPPSTPTSPAARAFRTSVEKLPKKTPSGEYRLDLVDSDPPSKEPA
jgi:hypothetical protein